MIITKINLKGDPDDSFVPDPNNWNGEDQNVPYIIHSDLATWDNAESKCNAIGSNLASITSQDENNKLQAAVIGAGNGAVWLGLNDKAQERIYVWADATIYDWKHWRPGQPNHGRYCSSYYIGACTAR
jgi:hypothetical protein